ncbi:MAG TPA: arginine--tRNA ligase [Solirubrobacteraceae bacterium]|jgi:arginyl-tRNA synthetase|nr:arginine--tRNA ligase [Solirubrobacteraceae bacterium]
MRVWAPTSASDIEIELAGRVVSAARAALGVELSLEGAVIRPAGPGRPADFQSNAALALAKRLGSRPAEVAAALVEALEVDDLAEPPVVSGPGFINFSIRRDWLERRLCAVAADERAGVPRAQTEQIVVVDYSAPNVAKEMHVGHLRSTIIGDAIVRTLAFAGHRPLPQNHVGDWGTPFGMLIEALQDQGWAEGDAHDIDDLNAFYQAARSRFDTDDAFARRARDRVVSLQAGDPPTLGLWRELVAESQRHFADVYRTLGVLLGPEHTIGESFYNDRLADVVDELERSGLAGLHDGAVCVFPPGFANRDGQPLPLIIRKRDGGYTYATTDLAAIRYRAQELGADRIIYVVGAPQRQHLEMIFATAGLAGWLGDDTTVEHVAFGSVLDENHKMLRTRAGVAVKLGDLLGEAVTRAAAILDDRSPDLAPAERDDLAAAVGIGAVKYADLAADREKDYVFSLDRMLSLDGNTSVYLQYANARIHSVLARAVELPDPATPILVGEPAERVLGLKLLAFPAVIDSVLESMDPHRLCTYLYATAVAFSGFYETCPILTADDAPTKASRLALARTTSRILTLGLGLLGIEAPQRL